MSPTDDVLVDQGNDAEVLLEHPAFNRSIDSIVETTFQTFVNSQYTEKEVRENAYGHYRALVDLVNTLKQRVIVRDGIHTKIERDNSETDERMDH